MSAAPAQPAVHGARIEAAIADRLAMDVRCVVVAADGVVDRHPFADVATDGARMMVLFLSAAPAPELLAAHDPVALRSSTG